MKIGYTRVITFEQKLWSKIDLLKETGVEEVPQKRFTGATIERPEFNKAIQRVINDDALTVTKTNRLSRNIREVLEIIQTLFNRKIKVHILNKVDLKNSLKNTFGLYIS